MDLAPSDLLADAGSSDWATRVSAADRLSAFLHDERARRAMLRLLTDPTNSAPAAAAAETLLRNGSPGALALFAIGWEAADNDLGEDLATELRVARSAGRASSTTWRALLATTDDDRVRSGAASILRWLDA